jgi:hypothetical protein
LAPAGGAVRRLQRGHRVLTLSPGVDRRPTRPTRSTEVIKNQRMLSGGQGVGGGRGKTDLITRTPSQMGVVAIQREARLVEIPVLFWRRRYRVEGLPVVTEC